MADKIISTAVFSLMILLGGALGSFVLFVIFIFSFSFIVFVPLYASIVLIVIFVLYEFIRYQLLGKPTAMPGEKYFDAERENLKQTNEKVYNAPIEDAVKFINEEMSRYKKDLGYANLNDRFGHYQELSGLLTRVKWQIENSRQSGDQGDALRRNIAESADFKALLNYFDELRSSIIAIRVSIAKKEATELDLSMRWWIGVSLTVIALVTVVLSIQNA